MASEEDLDRFLDFSVDTKVGTGLRSTWIMDPVGAASPSPDIVDRYAQALDPALLYGDYTPNGPYSPVISFASDVPFVRTAFVDNRAAIAGSVRRAEALQPDGPRFVAIGLNAWGVTADDAAAAMEELGRGYEAVAPDRFAALIHGAAADGYRGSPDMRVPIEPTTGKCRADLDHVSVRDTPYFGAFVANGLFAHELDADLDVVVHGSRVEVSLDAGALAAAVHDAAQGAAQLGYGPEAAATLRVTAGVDEVTVHFDGVDVDAIGDGTGVAPAAEPGTGRVTLTGTASEPVVSVGTSVAVSGRYRFTLTADLGDSVRSSNVEVPVSCEAPVREIADPPEETTTTTSTTFATSTTISANDFDFGCDYDHLRHFHDDCRRRPERDDRSQRSELGSTEPGSGTDRSGQPCHGCRAHLRDRPLHRLNPPSSTSSSCCCHTCADPAQACRAPAANSFVRTFGGASRSFRHRFARSGTGGCPVESGLHARGRK